MSVHTTKEVSIIDLIGCTVDISNRSAEGIAELIASVINTIQDKTDLKFGESAIDAD